MMLSTEELQEIISKYPYFSEARLKLVEKAADGGVRPSDDLIRSAAVYLNDRKLLYHLTTITEKMLLYPEVEDEDIVHKETASAETTTDADVLQQEVEEAPALELNNESSIQSDKKQIDEVITLQNELEPNEETLASAEIDAVVETATSASEEAPSKLNNFVNEAHTFDEWLTYFLSNKCTKPETLQRELPKIAVKPDAIEQAEILHEEELTIEYQPDYFHNIIKQETGYAKGLETFIEASIDKKKVRKKAPPSSSDQLPVTETFAKLMEQQGKYEKAILMYEKLTLKFPAKSSLFAARIEILKEKIK
jgi:hypothetical protein